jgi:glutathione S-transferase
LFDRVIQTSGDSAFGHHALNGDAAMFILRSTLTSPFGRKVRIGAAVLGLAERIRMVPADTLDPTDSLRDQNPLGKMPCLILEDGTAIYDSSVILEFLQEQAGSEALVARSGPARYRTLTQAKLVDGIADAGLLMVYEARFHEPEQISRRWLDHQRGKVERGLAALDAAPPSDALDLVGIGLVCALGYFDWRKPVLWRPTHPNLVAWLEQMRARHPIIDATQVPETA